MATTLTNDDMVLGLQKSRNVVNLGDYIKYLLPENNNNSNSVASRPTFGRSVSHETGARAAIGAGPTHGFTPLNSQEDIPLPKSPMIDGAEAIHPGISLDDQLYSNHTSVPGVWANNDSNSRRNKAGEKISSVDEFLSLDLTVSNDSGSQRRKANQKRKRQQQKRRDNQTNSNQSQDPGATSTAVIVARPPQVYVCDSPVEDALFVVPSARHPCVTRSELKQYDVQIVKPGSYVGSDSGYGYYCWSFDDRDNIKNCAVRPATNSVTLPGYRFKDEYDNWIEVPETSYRVFEPLFVKLNSQFRAAKITESILNAIAVHSTLDYGQHVVLTETLEYYKQLVTRRYYAQIQNTNVQRVVMNNANLIAKGDAGIPDAMDRNLDVDDKHDAWRIYDTECSLPLTWNVRDDFEVIKKSKVETMDSYHVCSDKGKYFRFSSVRVKPRYRTAFFKLGGIGIPDFVEYSNSAPNLTHGLKRLFGQKDNEFALRCNAILLGAHIARACSSFTDSNPKQIFYDLVGSQRKKGKYADNFAKAEAILNDRPYQITGGISLNPRDIPGYQLRERIAHWYRQVWLECTRTKIQRVLDSMNNAFHWGYYSIYEQCLTKLACCFSRDALAQIVHVKRKLRMRYVQGALLSDDDELLVNNLNVLIKRELGKFGKAPRLYVSYEAGCVYANELPEFCKMGLDGKHTFIEKVKHGPYAGTDISLTVNIMAKPKSDSVKDIFNDLYEAMSTPNHIYAAIYSDDMCIAGNIHGKKFSMNLDMESNDSSQDVPAFLASTLCMGNFSKHKALGLVKQCMLPLRIVSPEDPDSMLLVKMFGPMEGSGSVLTTLLNHLGSLLVILTILSVLVELTDINDDGLETAFKQSANIVGHTITIDNNFSSGICNFHNTQFLKRSPFYHDGKWWPYMNLGCILRSLGVVDDDLTENQLGLPHSKFCSLSNEERITMFTTAVVNGWQYEPTNPIMKALRTRFSSVTDEVRFPDSLKYVFNEDKPLDLRSLDNTDAIIARYGLTENEIDELARVIASIRVGQTIKTTAYAKIMVVDYGVKYEMPMLCPHGLDMHCFDCLQEA